MSYSPADPSTWDKYAASGFVVGLDVGIQADHSALVLAGVWPGAQNVIGVVDIKRFPLGEPLETVADEAAKIARENRARVVFDVSNNSAFAGVLAARMPRGAENFIVGAAITNAAAHAMQPTPMLVTVAGQRAAVRRWTLSKAELVETVAAEFGAKSLSLARAGDWELLHDELIGMERTIRASGSASYGAPAGKHDDLVMALALSAWGCRRFEPAHGGRARISSRRAPSALAWT
jgi:hypothetical protein